MKKIINLSVYLLMLAFPLLAETDCKRLFVPLAETIRKTDIPAFSEYFDVTVICDILGEEQQYNKGQVRQVIQKFFAAEGDVRSFTIKHCSGKERLKYAIGNLTTVNGSRYRLTIFASIDGDELKVQQLRIVREE
ncbi:MAG: DUF4783 domain-containing protein [Prevotellaceae bacterium]|jgi:hypothetical protein|nr:DUF4783 domain-containing protein [Prevotellaceae bacterium]